MKAIGINHYGSIDNLEIFDIPLDPLGPTDVLIDVKAISINPFDTKQRSGAYPGHPNKNRPLILGIDMAGIVSQVGESVTHFRVGDLVTGRQKASAQGTYREQIVISQDLLVQVPDNVMLESAAALLAAGEAAYHALFTHGNLEAGQKVLIHGGAGGVGHLAIQLAKLKGAHVATTSSHEHHDFLKKLGADVVIDYRSQDFRKLVRDIDLVVDTVGGETQQRSLEVLSPTGKIESLVGSIDEQDSRIHYFSAGFTTDSLREMLELMAAGKLSIQIRYLKPFTLENVKEAHRKLESKHGQGKIVLTL